MSNKRPRDDGAAAATPPSAAVTCQCGAHCARHVSGTTANPNKPYFSCPHFENFQDGHFWKWEAKLPVRQRAAVVTCKCGAHCDRHVSHSAANPDKPYFACPQWKNFQDGHFWKWEEKMNARQRVAAAAAPVTRLVKCRCGKQCLRVASHSEKNPGKVYYKCPDWRSFDDNDDEHKWLWEEDIGVDLSHCCSQCNAYTSASPHAGYRRPICGACCGAALGLPF
jgi:hypothetical protein